MQPKHVALLTVVISVFLTALSLWAGIFSGSKGLVGDGVHAAGDILASVIVCIGVGCRDASGQRKAAAALGIAMVLSALSLGYTALLSLLTGSCTPCSGAAAASESVALLLRTVIWRITARCGKVWENTALCANTRHLAADILSSAAVLAGAALSRLGYPMADSAACAAVAGTILAAGIQLIRASFGIRGKNLKRN